GSTVAALRDGHRRAFRSGIAAEGATSAILTAQACSSAAVAPAAAFQIPSAGIVSPFLARHRMHTGSRSRRVPLARHTGIRNRPATRRCGMIFRGARVAGLADRGQPLPLGGPARIRTGTVTAASLAASARAESSAPARRVARSLRASALDSAFYHPQRVARRRHSAPATRIPIAGSRCAEPCGAWQV
ncbi:MAG TPA: hypothetical protein PKM57_18345, partial [Kiritimatiellia bacterium]|nr:hypothetical protein [Kiritimatiellia bacterium]